MRVVICDDSSFIRDLLRGYITRLGHQVVGTGVNGREAIDLCRQHRPDLALLDMSMGDFGGDRAAPVIIAENLASKVLLVTSKSSALADFEAKGIPCLIKPIHPGTLEAKIKQLFEAS